ncbi:procyclic acidic repetitive family protein [Micromonospora sp. WMMD1082]|uniref:procyclic acidic repetitive family protein n=1 Tax=Micromonospora sp. WMMD1082 TaxID=3016104 RepID=UPI002417CB18|nr:procyclic acidic repetitive family protein [Micromonospora sp. WMMD1082]MDG4794481.1 procyclic acidic repetitive family protein [Micromonospora sp. WMMD1082]
MASTEADHSAAPGRIGGWLDGDRIGAAALAMIALSVLGRVHVASRGFLAADDYVMISQAAESELTVEHLLTLYNNHLMPGGRLITWLVTEHFGVAYWPYVLLMAIGQAILGVAFFHLLRRLLRPSALLLLPLGVLLFSPLTLEATSWWAVGVNLLPMQIAMVLAVGAQVGYVQTGRRRHLAILALSVVFGLVFFEKSILIVPLVFLLTAALYAEGGLLRSVWTTIRRWWPSWLLLTVLSLGFLAAYLVRSESSLRRPESAGEVFLFLRQLFGSTLIPGLVGGPWQWLEAGDGAPVAAPPELGTWVGWIIVVALIVATVRRGRRARRVWLLLGAYLLMVAALLAATRLGSVFSEVAGGVPRYVSDVVVVAAICVGVAAVGLARPSRATGGIEPPVGAGQPAGPDTRPQPEEKSADAPAPPPLALQPVTTPAVVAAPAAPVRAAQPVRVVSRPGVIHAEAPVDPEPEFVPPRTPEAEQALGPEPVPGPEPAPALDAAPTPQSAGTPQPVTRPDPDPVAEPEPTPPTRSADRPGPATAAVNMALALALVALCLGTAWTTARYGDEWAAKAGRSYIDTVRIEMASAPPGTVFFDAPVPDRVVPSLSWPYNLQSRFFSAIDTRPTFVDEADNLSVLDGLGRIQVAAVVGSTIQPGPQDGCGYLVTSAETVRMRLDEPRSDWHWVVRVGYLSSADGTATLRFGSGVAHFPVKKGLHQRFFRIVGGGAAVELTVAGADVSLCINDISIGDLAPRSE